MATAVEARAKWSFGSNASQEGGSLTNSTGTGTRQNVGGLSRENFWYIETDANATCSYQILVARTLTGATTVISSGTMAASALNIVHLTGPVSFTTARIKTITSTSVNVTVEYFGN